VKVSREGRKLPREERKEASKGREERSFQGKRERKLPREGRKEHLQASRQTGRQPGN